MATDWCQNLERVKEIILLTNKLIDMSVVKILKIKTANK